MDSTQKPGSPELRARLLLPAGETSSGTLAVKGARAVVFFSDDLFIGNWPDDRDGHLVVGSGELESTVALNGTVDDGLDLTLTGMLNRAQATFLGMPAETPYDAGGARALAASLVASGSERFDELLGTFLVELGDRLFDRATAPGLSARDRRYHHDALGALRQSTAALRADVRQRIEAAMATLDRGAGDGTAGVSGHGALELVGFAEMEETLVLERMVSDAVERYRLDLEALTLRAGDLLALGGARVRTPFHPRLLCGAFDGALKALGFDEEALLDALRLYHRNVVQRLARFYLDLNHDFALRGLRPGLEEELNSGASILHSARENRPFATEHAPRETRDAEREAERPAPPPGGLSRRQQRVASGPRRRRAVATARAAAAGAPLLPELPAEAIHAALRHALAHRPQAPIETPDGAGPAVTPEQLVALLAELQRQMPATGEEPRALSELVAAQGASTDPESGGQIAFVDRIFGGLATSGAIGEELRGSMERLRIPLARLAILEPRVFADPAHPAHRVVDKVSRLAATENFPNPALARKLDALTARINSDYDGDPAVFAQVDSELEELLLQQADAVERNVQRVIGGMEGQEKLRAARAAVIRLLDESLPGDRVPRALLDLLDAGLRDLLTQTAVREGTGSEAWRSLVQHLEELLAAMRDVDRGDSGPARARALQPGVQELGQAIRSAQPGNVNHEPALRELLDIAGGERPLETCPLPPQLPAEQEVAIPDHRLADLPRLRRWLQRVDDLQTGTVMSYRGEDGGRRRMRLVWISEDRERFTFVNAHGRKVAELTRLQLARKLSRGLKPPAPVDHMSLLHRGVFDTLASAQEKLGAERARDAVTDLANDRLLLRHLGRAVTHAQQHDALHAFLCLDIDAFHLVNELYEEADGDQVLAGFARRLAQLNERRSFAGRLAGDQFGVVLAYRDGGEALALAETIRGDIANASIDVAGEAVRFTVSIGVAPITAAAESAEDVLGQARSALAVAKAAGGNRCESYAASPVAAADLDRDLRRQRVESAIADGKLELRAQPIMQHSTDDSRPASHYYEILLAVRDDDGALAGPGEFIAEAERAGAMDLVDRWVIHEVCAWVSALMDRQREVPQVAINLSGQSLRDDTFIDYVLERLSEFGVGTSKLCFEITEAGAAESLTKASDFVRTLRNIGCKFSLDDFGVGGSSRDYLRQLPVDYVKIDGSFVRRVHENAADRAMVRSLNDLAHFLGQETIAECVETMEVAEPLQELGIDRLQGWGVGLPRSLEEVARELRPLET